MRGTVAGGAGGGGEGGEGGEGDEREEGEEGIKYLGVVLRVGEGKTSYLCLDKQRRF